MKFIFLFLLLNLNLKTQYINKSEFVNSEWFADNSNQNFYKADTIYLRKMLKYECDDKKLSRAHVILLFNQNEDVEVLNFYKRDKISFSDISMNLCSHLRLIENWKWKFDEKSQTLNFDSDKSSKLSYKVLQKDSENRTWECKIEEGKYTKFKAEFITLKLLKIK
jgi:hypothetical protein